MIYYLKCFEVTESNHIENLGLSTLRYFVSLKRQKQQTICIDLYKKKKESNNYVDLQKN